MDSRETRTPSQPQAPTNGTNGAGRGSESDAASSAAEPAAKKRPAWLRPLLLGGGAIVLVFALTARAG